MTYKSNVDGLSLPYWHTHVSKAPVSTNQLPKEVDCAIVGAGFTGVHNQQQLNELALKCQQFERLDLNMAEFNNLNDLQDSSCLPLQLPTLLQSLKVLEGVDLWMKRDDLIHPIIAGNKWRKLIGFFAKLPAHSQVLTFGGAYSNHLAAAATAMQALGHGGVFVVRGDELNADSSPVLKHCADAGMDLHFVSRQAFRQLREHAWQPSRKQLLAWQVKDSYTLLAEGGSGAHNDLGCAQLWQELQVQGPIDHLWLAAGTAGTVQGLLRAMPQGCMTHITVVSAVKGSHREATQTQALARGKNLQLTWLDETQFGGFAKSNSQLQLNSDEFYKTTGINLDPVYNAKVWWQLQQARPHHGKVVWINTGGLRLPA